MLRIWMNGQMGHGEDEKVFRKGNRQSRDNSETSPTLPYQSICVWGNFHKCITLSPMVEIYLEISLVYQLPEYSLAIHFIVMFNLLVMFTIYPKFQRFNTIQIYAKPISAFPQWGFSFILRFRHMDPSFQPPSHCPRVSQQVGEKRHTHFITILARNRSILLTFHWEELVIQSYFDARGAWKCNSSLGN